MTSLREKMKQDMILNGLAGLTQKSYLEAILRLYKYYNKSPAKLSNEEIRNYLLHLKEKGLAPNSYNVFICALRFFYDITLRRPQMKLELPMTKVVYKLPQILSIIDVQKIINSIGNIKHKTLLTVVYGAGLRVSEAINLRVEDIDSARMMLHIRCGKNGKDRYVTLPSVVLEQLRTYWKHCKFTGYLFPSTQNSSGHITRDAALLIYKEAKERAGIKKMGGIHALRHAYATHALESGSDLYTIKQMLGHASLSSTARYLRLTQKSLEKFKPPIEQLDL